MLREAFMFIFVFLVSTSKFLRELIRAWGKAMANYSQELAQDAVCQSNTGHMNGL